MYIASPMQVLALAYTLARLAVICMLAVMHDDVDA